MTSEKQAGFSLLEVIVSTAILFSVAGAFLSMTAANGVLLTREHSLMQNVYELSELAEEGQGEWTGEELEIIFEGEEEDASEIFGKYIVTSEGGDSMTYYKRGIPMRNRDGFTLLELVAALSLSAVIGIWAAGFFGSQMHEYKKQTQILKTEELADRVCFQITSRLDHAFLFRVDPKESSVLYYCEGSGELGEQWEQISEEDLGLGAEKEYEVRLDFSDTQSQKAVSEITVLYKGEKVYSRTIRLSSVYGYLEDGEDEKGENENKDGSLSW